MEPAAWAEVLGVVPVVIQDMEQLDCVAELLVPVGRDCFSYSARAMRPAAELVDRNLETVSVLPSRGSRTHVNWQRPMLCGRPSFYLS